jgi:hypothetical protein
MGDLQDTVKLAKTFRETFEFVRDKAHGYCEPLVRQRDSVNQKNLSNWLGRNIIYQAGKFTEDFTRKPKLKDEEARSALIDAVKHSFPYRFD